MTKGQFLSSYQKGIVRRYYSNLDTIALQKLAEAATELYLTKDPKKLAKIWESVAKALPKVVEDRAEVEKIIASRDVKLLAEVVNDLSGPRKK
jgi:hypothetical protein